MIEGQRGPVFHLERVDKRTGIVGVAHDPLVKELQTTEAIETQADCLRAAWAFVDFNQRDSETTKLSGNGPAHNHVEVLRRADWEEGIDDVGRDRDIRRLRGNEDHVRIGGGHVGHLELGCDVTGRRVAFFLQDLEFHAAQALAQDEFAEFDLGAPGTIGRTREDHLNLDISSGYPREGNVVGYDSPRPGRIWRIAGAHLDGNRCAGVLIGHPGDGAPTIAQDAAVIDGGPTSLGRDRLQQHRSGHITVVVRACARSEINRKINRSGNACGVNARSIVAGKIGGPDLSIGVHRHARGQCAYRHIAQVHPARCQATHRARVTMRHPHIAVADGNAAGQINGRSRRTAADVVVSIQQVPCRIHFANVIVVIGGCRPDMARIRINADAVVQHIVDAGQRR